ncbi:hypothetical protein BJY04DRAFT_95708 [Aspergillus karnatakaensis]|uniref:BRCT domain protein n=1 Tax=Aspergillus karnatakaensis TaxID=1810916 RepID=UPI003CCD2ECD
MGKTFQRIHASSVGNFDRNTNKIPGWITANGGIYTKEVTNGVTHLIASRDAFVSNDPAVIEAKRLGTVKIVSYDWLAESLLSRTRSPRNAQTYLWVNILKEEKDRKKRPTENGRGEKQEVELDKETEGKDEAEGQAKVATAEEKKGKLESVKKRRKKRGRGKSRDPFDTKQRTEGAKQIASQHRIYEAEDVTHLVNLSRPADPDRKRMETIELKIFETREAPHTYATHIRMSISGPCKTALLAPIGSTLQTAMVAFKDYFKAQNGREWDDRYSDEGPAPRVDAEGNAEPPHKGWFRFDSRRPLWMEWLG